MEQFIYIIAQFRLYTNPNGYGECYISEWYTIGYV